MEIYKELTLLRGDKVQIIICRGVHLSNSFIMMQQHNILEENKDKQLDLFIFLMRSLCFVNGEKKPLSYYESLLIDDYIKIMNVNSEQLESLNLESL